MQQTVLITGGSSGIGYELANIFGQKGYRLILIAHNKENLKAAKIKLNSEGFPVKIFSIDLSDQSSPTKICEWLKKENEQIDVLINNAGFATHGLFSENDLQKELAELQVNIVTLTHLTKLIIRDMIKNKKGKILNVASTAAFVPGPLMAVYYASKAYVLSFSQSLNTELENTDIHVTALCPGPTNTGFAKRAGVTGLRLFSGKNMSASSVAKQAYVGLMKNQAIVIPGFRNKLMVESLKLVPRSIISKVVKNIQSKRRPN